MSHNTFLQFSLLLDIFGYFPCIVVTLSCMSVFVVVRQCRIGCFNRWWQQGVFTFMIRIFLYIFQSVVDSSNTYRALTGPFILSFQGDFEVIYMIIPIFEFEHIHTPMPT